MSSSIQGMRLEAIAAYVPGDVWSNARVAARLRLERMRLSARAKRALRGPIPDEEAKLRDDDYQAKLVEALFTGIRRYFARNPPLARQRAL